MLRKAFFRAFFFLLLMAALASPAFAFVEGEGYSKGAPSDSQAPLSNGMTWFVRRVPVLLYNPNSVTASLEGNKGEISLSDVDLVWGELWTKPGWAQEGSRYGLNELYIPINSNMTPAPASGTKKVILPDADFDDPDVVNFLADYFDVLPQVRYIDKGNAWAGDASSGIFVNVPMPSREDFLAQEAGMNDSLAAKWKPYLANKAYSDGLIPSADGSTQYLRALDAFDHGATFYYHLLLNPGPQSANWAVAAETSPNYDENAPDGIGFYRGKDWSDQLKNSPASVPGFIGAVTPWANLKLEGPVEITGAPGEEKEAQYTITNESSADLAPDVAVKREGGTYVTAAAGVPVKAWDKTQVTLKFKVEDKPYKVRVAVNPFGELLESTYKDNYVDVTVKPIAPDMYVKLLDPGASEAEPGKAYTGTVVYGLAADYPVPVKATLSLTNNGYYATASNGTPLNDQVPVEFQPGEEKTFTFTWHGDANGNTLVAKIHPVNPPDDRDWSNNKKETYVPPAAQCTDISASLTYSPRQQRYAGMNTALVATISRDNEGPAGPVQVKVTISGNGIYDTKYISLNRGGSTTLSWVIRPNTAGSYTFKVTAAPIGVEDCRPGNNSDTVTVPVGSLPGFNPPDSKISVELIS
ncbi:hypothetical protein [Neomoorella humiferrea]|uniref:CARDB domain-containing protein n=1 Tax=Neomoorella humiferrea TaxID=676965 RepID=A0A2T0ARF0_9FIRM|nr:hypothetical protein [Moorella humiferrea]PRR71948.1 hypothetical protein MOHU_15800 [Moorella humiferrea]